MAITVVQQSTGANSGGTTGLATSFAVAVASGNGVVVCVGSTSADATSVTDTQGNTYTEARTDNFFTSPYASVWHCASVTGGFTTVTVNFAGSTACAAVAVEVLGAIATIESNTHNANGANPTPGAITTGAADRIVVACVRNGTSETSPSGFTNLYNAGAAFFDACYEIFTTIQTNLNPAWTATGSPYAAVQVAYSSTITTPPTVSFVTQKVLAGPPIPGSPWMMARPWQPPRLPRTAPPVMPPDVIRTYTPATYGPPIPGSPWTAKFGFPRTPAVPPPPPVEEGDDPLLIRAKGLDFIEPNPREDPIRGARIANKLSSRWNSAVRRGEIVRVGNQEWSIRGSGHTSDRDPTSADDSTRGFRASMVWVNTATRSAFICVDNTAGMATWAGPI